MILESAITTRLGGKLMCTCGINKWINAFLVSPMRLPQVLHDGFVFLIMGMTMPATLRAQCWKNTCVELTHLMLCYEIHSSRVNGL